MRKAIVALVNSFMVAVAIVCLFTFGSIVFDYKLPFVEEKSKEQMEKDFEEYNLPIKVKELKAMVYQRDSLRAALDSCKNGR